MFDPENVRRLLFTEEAPEDAELLEGNGEFVRAEDYDQLLKLYRAVTRPLVDGKDYCIIGGEVVLNPLRPASHPPSPPLPRS